MTFFFPITRLIDICWIDMELLDKGTNDMRTKHD